MPGRADDGASAVEYGLLLAGVAAVIVTSVALFGTDVAGLYAAVVADWP